MLTLTAQDAASIHQVQIQVPFFGERAGIEWPQVPYVVKLPGNLPEAMIVAPIFISSRWSATPATPSQYSVDEILEWDFVAGPKPGRRSGTVSVTLEYVGRGEPKNAEDIWD